MEASTGRLRSYRDFLAAEPVRVSAVLRLPLIVLIAVLVWFWEVDHWLPQLYAVILGVYAAVAVVWLLAVLRGARAGRNGRGRLLLDGPDVQR